MTDYPLNTLPDDEWETCVGAGRMMAETMDAHRFHLGDLALTVEKRYGTDALGAFATEIGMARKATLKEYRRVAARFPANIRMAFWDALSWSHFQCAMKAKDDAELFLAKAADEGWPVAELSNQIKAAKGERVPPRLLWSGEAFISFRGWNSMMFICDDPPDIQGLRVVVKVWTEAADG